MATLTRLAAASALITSFTAPPAAHAAVATGHWSVATGTLWQYNAQAGTLRFVTSNLDEGASLYLVKPGEVVSQAMVDAPGAHNLGNGTDVLVGTDFYLGAATSSLSDPGVSWSNVQQRTSFGWAHFQAQADGSLKILSSATAFREAGIVVGTLQAVPEPSAWALMGLGLLGLTAVARRRG